MQSFSLRCLHFGYSQKEIAMTYSEEKMAMFVALLEKHTPEEGLNVTAVPDLITYRNSSTLEKCASVYEQGIVILGQGKKYCYVDGQKYDYSVGNYLSLYLPMPIDVEVIDASPERPLLMAGIKIDLIRIANILMKMDQAGQQPTPVEPLTPSVIFSKPVSKDLLDAVIRLLLTLDNPVERAVLGDSILDELYFRLICDDQSGSLQRLLQHRGQVQQISKAVDHIHNHMDKVVSVNELASLANMSTSGFRKTFREVMHMPPLQYAKSIKLNQAQTFIREGKNASEAGYLVGYNSPAQFSREYKRHFGFAPSATVAMA
ncbi:MAG: AraC family transcriptional regulator [Chloroflexi bacterium]|nr:MAG: AraC family transcriptional regulator [Chloroflexota bacterium]